MKTHLLILNKQSSLFFATKVKNAGGNLTRRTKLFDLTTSLYKQHRSLNSETP